MAAQSLGTLKELWRYPVKSMGGERIEAGVLNNSGLAGDRCWAVVDGESREIRHAKRWPELMHYRARLQAADELVSSGTDGEVPDVEIISPSGELLRGRQPDIAAALSTALNRSAALLPLAPAGNRDHYRLAQARTLESMTAEMGLLEGESFPDMSATPEQLMVALADCVTPPGTYVDAYPLHLMTTNSLRYLRERGGVDAVVQRYRPNFLFEPSESLSAMTENEWLNCRVQLGEAILMIHSRTVRCSMPSRPQNWCDIAAEPSMARAMVDHCDRHLGVNVMVERGGKVSVGDPLIAL